MNWDQQKAVFFGLLLVSLMAAFPPWDGPASYDCGYSFVFSPPGSSSHVHWSRLGMQVCFIAVTTSAFAVLLHGGRMHFWHTDEKGNWYFIKKAADKNA